MPYRIVFALLFLLSSVASAQDTFSIVAVDTVTGEIGSAGATCLARNQVAIGALIISDVIPGVGAIHTQAFWQPANQQMAHDLMLAGFSPQQIVDTMEILDIDNSPELRQYGIVDLRDGHPRSAGYTGFNCNDYKNHVVGANYAIQGNILLGQHILDSMEARFLREPGTLSDKLMAALQGANVPGADTRCLDSGKSSASAFIRVAKPTDDGANLYLHLVVTKTRALHDPIDSLQTLYTAWKQSGLVAKEYSNSDYEVRFENGELICTHKSHQSLRSYGTLTLEVYDLGGRALIRKEVSGDTFKVSMPSAVKVCLVKLLDGESVVYAGKVAEF